MKTMTYSALAGRLVDLRRLSEEPCEGERCGECSSYEKLSRYDAATGRYLDWAANNDNGSDTPRTPDGGYLAVDLTGPGALVRIWSADPREGHIKIFLDGQETPAVDLPFYRLFGSGPAPFDLPGLCYDASRGKNCFVPIPYQKSCRVVFYGDWGLYYQFQYLCFSPDTAVEPFSLPLAEEALSSLKKVSDFFREGLGKAPASYPGEKRTSGRLTLPAGKRCVFFEKKGAGAITGILVKLEGLTGPEEEWRVLSELSLSAFWDGEERPAVFSSLGGFFASVTGLAPSRSLPLGVMEDGRLYCYWYMPYEAGGKLVLQNDGAGDCRLSFEVIYQALSREEVKGRLRFHAKWKRAADPVRGERWPDALFLATEGKGRFVGTSLHVYKAIGRGDPAYHPEWWWGEGDEKFFVDGEKFPSWFGTGSEDYFGYAWGCWQPFSKAFHSQPFTNGGMFGAGNRLNNRFQVIDSIPFERTFEGYLEKYHRDGYANWAFTSFWYLEPGGKDPYPEASFAERSAYYEAPFPKATGFIEGERLTILESTGMLSAEAQEMAAFPDDSWSGGEQLFFRANRPGDYVKFRFRVADEGDYRLILRLTMAPDYGLAEHAVDGCVLGDAVDLYAEKVLCREELSLPPCHLADGFHELTVRAVGKNKASSGYFYGLDYLKIEKL